MLMLFLVLGLWLLALSPLMTTPLRHSSLWRAPERVEAAICCQRRAFSTSSSLSLTQMFSPAYLLPQLLSRIPPFLRNLQE